MNRKTLYTISAIFFIAILGFVSFPFSTKLIDRVEPHILGLPCMQFCLLFAAFGMAIWLIIWLALEIKIDDKAADEENSGEEAVS